jgi:hypothetical protein
MSDTTAAAPASRVIDPRISITLANGTSRDGRLEYFIPSKQLVVFADDELLSQALTVKVADAPDAYAALQADEVLLRNWTELRGAAASLVDQGIVELTGVEVPVTTFRLQALVARVL